MKFKRYLALILVGGNALAAESIMEVIPLQNRPAAEIQPLLQPLLDDDERIVDGGSNLIVKTSPPRLEHIRALVGQLDTRLHNLAISVLQSSRKTADELNAEAGLTLSTNKIHMHGMNADTRDLDARRDLQQLRTLEGQAAHIEAGQQRPINTTTVYDSGYGYPGVANTTQIQTASTGFAVIPRLVGNEEVLIAVEPWSERFQNNGTVSSQNASTSIRARLGEWVEIAGIATDSRSNDRGFNGLNYNTQSDDRRILIKVERID